MLGGGLIFWFDDAEVIFKEGDRYDVLAGKEHTARAGAESSILCESDH